MIFYLRGDDVWQTNPQAVFWFFGTTFVCLGLSYGLVLWSRRPGNSEAAKYLLDCSAGKAVTRAQAILEEIERFERE